jgi:hypothetical protein
MLWATFRLNDDQTYDQRYRALVEAVNKLIVGCWAEPTSYWAIDTNLSLIQAMARMAAPLDAKMDLLVLGSRDAPGVLYFGRLENPDAFKSLFPNAQKYG